VLLLKKEKEKEGLAKMHKRPKPRENKH